MTAGTLMASACSGLVHQLADRLPPLSLMIATAESCTGGMIAAACTDPAGSSAWFDRGFVTYSNEAKADMLGVAPALIDAHGAVSEAVARAMVQGALARSKADVAVAVTGVAGPSGGTPDKPVGTVWLAWASRQQGAVTAELCLFVGDRAAVRQQTCERALQGLLSMLPPASST